MSIFIVVAVIGVAVVAYAVYQLVKAKKAVTAANVVAQAKVDVAAVKSDVKKS